jgi:hypothetical protein
MATTRGTTSTVTTYDFYDTTRTYGSFADHEPGLWRAVITQALMDAATRSRKPDARRTREDALRWLLGDSNDFEAVCDNAGFDPGYVRKRAREALDRGCEWRLPSGQGWRTNGRTMATLQHTAIAQA